MTQGPQNIIAISLSPLAGQLSLLLSLLSSAVFSLPKQFPGNRQDVRESRVREDARALVEDRHRHVEQLLDPHPQELEDRRRLGRRPLAAARLLLGLGLGTVLPDGKI